MLQGTTARKDEGPGRSKVEFISKLENFLFSNASVLEDSLSVFSRDLIRGTQRREIFKAP